MWRVVSGVGDGPQLTVECGVQCADVLGLERARGVDRHHPKRECVFYYFYISPNLQTQTSVSQVLSEVS